MSNNHLRHAKIRALQAQYDLSASQDDQAAAPPETLAILHPRLPNTLLLQPFVKHYGLDAIQVELLGTYY